MSSWLAMLRSQSEFKLEALGKFLKIQVAKLYPQDFLFL